jgi:hypothetical protein
VIILTRRNTSGKSTCIFSTWASDVGLPVLFGAIRSTGDHRLRASSRVRPAFSPTAVSSAIPDFLLGWSSLRLRHLFRHPKADFVRHRTRPDKQGLCGPRFDQIYLRRPSCGQVAVSRSAKSCLDKEPFGRYKGVVEESRDKWLGAQTNQSWQS